MDNGGLSRTVKRLKELETENMRLRKAIADLTLVGARIASDAGASLGFKRRKAETHAGTLLTLGEVEQPLQDDALAPFLGMFFDKARRGRFS